MSSPTTAPRLAFTKADFQWSYIVIILAAIATVAVLVVWPVVELFQGQPLRTRLLLPEAHALQGSVGGAALTSDSALVAIAGAPWWAWLTTIGRGALIAVAVLTVLGLLWGLLRTASTGAPFQPANLARLRVMAIVLIGAPIVISLLNGFLNPFLLRLLLPESGLVWLSRLDILSGIIVAYGVLLAFIAQVFSRGIELEHDVQGLV